MMKMKKMIAAALALVLSAPAVFSQGWPAGRVQATLVENYDNTTAGFTYVAFGDRNASVSLLPVTGVLGPGTAVNIKAKTVGSLTTVTSFTAGTKPFQGLAVGDLLIFPKTETTGDQERVITTWTDAENIVVNSAIDLTSGYTFRIKKLLSSTSANRVFFDVSGFDNFTIQADVNTINATSLDFILECRNSPYGRSFSDTTWTKNFTAVGSFQIHVTSRQDQCRVGWKTNTDTGVQAVATYFHGAR